MDQPLFTLETEEGIKTCKVLFTFDTDDHSYCIYSILDENGNDTGEISAVRYETDENLEMSNFQDLESEEEWDMVEEVYNTLVDAFTDEQNTFFATDEDGNEVECQIMYRFELEETGKKYVVYTVVDEGKNGELYAASFEESEDGGIEELFPIETEEEWKKIEEIVERIQR
ncbi:DUF1292 domain-containing protein [Ureibacillus sp. FSL K6-8385]|nr:DUF1292 domain-containing protein [Ureibacillus terrenus]MED3661484.1 DUF1292 domain-containing protein [Ureibacillus terrenus]MED3763951.1 DUF1292 domain-containing protein [Ureibacillus terrenus]